MGKLRGNKSSAVGMFVDGLDLKVAKLSIKRGNVVIEDLRSSQLMVRLEEQAPAEGAETAPAAAPAAEGGESFAVPTGEGGAEGGGGDNNSILLGMLSNYPQGQYAVSYALAEPSLYYHVFESDFGLSGHKLTDRIIEELKTVRSTAPAADAVSYFTTSEKNILCVVREGGLALHRAVEQIVPYIGKRLPRFPLIDSADVTLINLARANYGFAEEEVTVIVYVGTEFTRLIFMKGQEFFHLAALIGEGFDAPNLQNTVYARLLLEQDTIGIPRIDKILLAGESKKISFDEFLREQLPEIEIQYLGTPYLDVSELPPEQQELIPSFAVPIATAWKVLDEEHPAFYPVNLLPASVWESQRAFKLAWHGYLLLALVFLSTIFFPQRFLNLRDEKAKKEVTVKQMEGRLVENQKLRVATKELDDSVKAYNFAKAVYDSIVPSNAQWHKAIEHISRGSEDVKNIWLTSFDSPGNGSINLNGFAVKRDRIRRISALFDYATLASVADQEKCKVPIHSFAIKIPPRESVAKEHYLLGISYRSQGRKEEAINEFEKFLEICKDAGFHLKEMSDANARLDTLKRK